MTSEVLNYIPPELLENQEDNCIAPSFAELDELSKIDNIEKRVIVIRDGSNIEACAVCYIERRRHHGIKLNVYSLFGYLVHDYSRIMCKSRSAMNYLISAATADAKEHHCDIIDWHNIPVELVPNGTLPIHSEIKIFSASECEQGWKRFYNSKHVKYLINKIKKTSGNYDVKVIDGFVPDDLMEQLANFHIERWRFAGSNSPFSSNKNRISEYRAHSSNKHYLRIFAGDEIIGCHYGMRYGDSLLFHTPLINPKYLDLSPMKLILAETARYCESNGISSIDFGHGDEAYKGGYCEKPRYTCHFSKIITARGRVSNLIGLISKTGITESTLKIQKKIFKNHTLQRIAKEKSTIIRISDTFTLYNGIESYLVDNWMDYYDLATKFHLPINKTHYQRFHSNKTTKFVLLTKNGERTASGWINGLLPGLDTSSIMPDNSYLSVYDIFYIDKTQTEPLLGYISSEFPNNIKINSNRKLVDYLLSNPKFSVIND